MLGAHLLPEGGAVFSVWAPRARSVALRRPGHLDLPMQRGAGEVYTVTAAARAGDRYQFLLDGERARPDPRSRFQPEGVHGPSQLIDPRAYVWKHAAPIRALADYVIYELHVGAYTDEGSFAAAAADLARLAALGITAVELMPVAAFPGPRNWGYDGVDLYAPQAAYGTPDQLRALVDEAHRLGLSVVLDVVYNHLGPEGNYLSEFGPYFTSARHTPWGDALDYTRREVRDFLVDNALSFRDEFHLDALRLDAIHAIDDPSPRHFLAELCERARPLLLIAETDLNRTRVFDEWGFDACWSDDFHHALHACLTGERGGYYKDFGALEHLARALESGWVRGPEPERSRGLSASRLVVAAQTHDQIGNRALGERLVSLAGFPSARLAAVAVLAAAPAVPLLFMGEEIAATSPFLYFTSHGDAALARAVCEGRRREFAAAGFAWPESIPDPQSDSTFRRSKLPRPLRALPPHEGMERLYRDLLTLRRAHLALGARDKALCRARVSGQTLWVERGPDLLVALHLDSNRATNAPDNLRLLLHSEDRRYGGTLESPGHFMPPRSAALYTRG